ncbi:MAG TPA: HEAT repeat domain-containing protein, partial [Burkholderiales bacterium]|nr:HEAT repeat domain-containing protein [Burkholderiales bacterium]
MRNGSTRLYCTALRRLALCLATVALVAALSCRTSAATTEPAKPPLLPWQIAAFKASINDPSPAVRREALSWVAKTNVSVSEEVVAIVAGYLRPNATLNETSIVLEILADAKTSGAAHIDRVLPLIHHSNAAIRMKAARAIVAFGTAGVAHVEKLANLLNDPDDAVADASARLLTLLAERETGAEKYVLQALGHKRDRVAHSAAQSLAKLHRVAPAYAPSLIEMLKGQGAETSMYVGRAAFAALARIPDLTPEHVLALTSSPYDQDATSQQLATAFRKAGPAGTRIVKQQLRYIDDVDRPLLPRVSKFLAALTHTNPDVPRLVALRLDDQSPIVRRNALVVLQEIGAGAGEFASRVAARLNDNSASVRAAAASALAALGAAGEPFVPQLVNLLKDDNPVVGSQAAAALASMGVRAKAALPKLVELLGHKDISVRSSALLALPAIDVQASASLDALKRLLAAEESGWRQQAAQALERLGPAAAGAMDELAERANDRVFNVRMPAIRAIGRIGPAAAAHAPQLAALLKDQETSIRAVATVSLSQLGQTAGPHAASIAELLSDPNLHVRDLARDALLRLGSHSAGAVPHLQSLLTHDSEGVRERALAVLVSVGGFATLDQHISLRLHALEAARRYAPKAPSLLAAYRLAPLEQHDIDLIRSLGGRAANEALDFEHTSRRDAFQLLQTYMKLWSAAHTVPQLRKEMAENATKILRIHEPAPGDVLLVEGLKRRFDEAGLKNEALALRTALDDMATYRTARTILAVGVVHLLLWCGLIFAYPRSPLIQSLFFWNKWARRFLGFGYVGLLITIVPSLRRRMLSPFTATLLPVAMLRQYDADTYFENRVLVRQEERGREMACRADDLMSAALGKVILKGESGTGKTLFLLRLALNSKRPVVFLKAAECTPTVISAIQTKVQGAVGDEDYLRTLIYAGALDIYIDGLNEASPQIRFGITQFAEEMSKGNFFISMQPIAWTPPATARIYLLKPLRMEQIEPFLLKQWPQVRSDAIVDEDEYRGLVHGYVTNVVSTSDATPRADARLLALTNPMDASLAAELLAMRVQPDTLRLIEQRFHVAECDFSESYGRKFPLGRFAERVYAWRTSAEPYMSTEGFEAEVAVLTKHKLMLERTETLRKRSGSENQTYWLFRHDRIMDFFTLFAFLGPEASKRRHDHIEDARFFGV